MANKNLTDLTARTATADSDLIHVNSGGVDYKESKADFLKGSFYYEFGNTSLITSQVDSLPTQGTWFGRISSYGKQSETGAPENFNGDLFVQKFNGNYAVVDFHLIGNPDLTYRICKKNGTWDSAWTKLPQRAEITSLNSSLTNSIHGVATVTSNSSKAISVGNSTRALVITFGFSDEATQIFIVTSTSGGTTTAYPCKTATGMSASISGSTLTLINSTGSNAYICALVFSGSVESA